MEYRFMAMAVVRLIEIIDLWPCPNRAAMKVIDGLAVKLQLKEEELEAIQWRPAESGGFVFVGNVVLGRELSEEDVQVLGRLAENPPEGKTWTRGDRALQAAVFAPLGLEPWV